MTAPKPHHLLYMLAAVLFGAQVFAAVPQPVRDSAHDWRCLNPDGTATNHQRQDTAIYACQTRAAANPGQTYYIEGGRYRVRVEPVAPPPVDPPPVEPPADPDPPAPDPDPEPEPVEGTITVTWTPPAQRVDGSPVTNLAGYRIHWGVASRVYTGSLEITDPLARSWTIVGLVPGDYYLAMTAYDADGHESAYSNEIVRTATAPEPPPVDPPPVAGACPVGPNLNTLGPAIGGQYFQDCGEPTQLRSPDPTRAFWHIGGSGQQGAGYTWCMLPGTWAQDAWRYPGGDVTISTNDQRLVIADSIPRNLIVNGQRLRIDFINGARVTGAVTCGPTARNVQINGVCECI